MQIFGCVGLSVPNLHVDHLNCTLRKNKIIISKRDLYSHVHSNIIHNSQDIETMLVFIDGK